MKMLVLGGTRFLSRAVAVEAVARGHEVTCANRGVSGAQPDGADHVHLDRSTATDPDAEPWSELFTHRWDAVVDVTSTPSWAATAVAALAGRARHWSYVSSVSVYARHDRHDGTVENTPVLPAATSDLDMSGDPEAYGRCKAACEQAVATATGGNALVVRAGLIVGPGDPSGRFSYWPQRLSRGGRVLAPGPATSRTQVIDVRDLADWIVTAAESETSGIYDAVGPDRPMSSMLAQIAAGVGGEQPQLVWADPDVLVELDVNYWAGPRSLPLWLPPEVAGMSSRDAAPAQRAGLTSRPVEQTAADTLAWLRSAPEAPVTGLTEAEEADVLAALSLKPRNRIVHAALVRADVPGRIVTLPDAATTAPLAASALGCEVGTIANSLVFWADDEPLLVMASGAHRVDTAALAARLGKNSIERADPAQVRAATGQAIGGVAPVGHPTPLTTVIDTSLAEHAQIWAAGGTPHTVFPMTYAELVSLTGGVETSVTG